LYRYSSDGANLAAREDMCLCSYYGGLSLANAKLGAVHG
jgi:alcohol dehydrogenase class IV